jgi:anti-anti-sigma regulatory factor
MTIVLCDVGGVVADAASVEALARLQLVARRAGCDLRLRNASPELRDLVAFMGLRDVLPEEETATPQDAAADRTAGRSSRCRGRR